MSEEEIKEILNKLSNRKQETLLQGIRDCQLKNIEHVFITKEEYIDKVLNYINNLQQENKRLKNNWNELKKWLEEYKEYCELEIKKGIALHTYDELDRNKRYGDITTCLYKVCNKMQELEGNNE